MQLGLFSSNTNHTTVLTVVCVAVFCMPIATSESDDVCCNEALGTVQVILCHIMSCFHVVHVMVRSLCDIYPG